MSEVLCLPIINNDIAESKKEMMIHEEKDFSYDGYQVVRGEFFAHLFEPSVTLNKEKVSVNAACIRKLPDVEYVQFLVNPVQRKLAVKPCREEMKDSFQWCSGDGKKRKPKVISCKIFYAKVMDLMGWDPNDRHKILGKLIRTKEDLIFVFDLNAAETYISKHKDNTSASRKPTYPDAWKNQFGLSVHEHQDVFQVDIFNDYAVFRIDKSEEEKARKEGSNDQSSTSHDVGHEEAEDQDTQTNASRTE